MADRMAGQAGAHVHHDQLVAVDEHGAVCGQVVERLLRVETAVDGDQDLHALPRFLATCGESAAWQGYTARRRVRTEKPTGCRGLALSRASPSTACRPP